MLTGVGYEVDSFLWPGLSGGLRRARSRRTGSLRLEQLARKESWTQCREPACLAPVNASLRGCQELFHGRGSRLVCPRCFDFRKSSARSWESVRPRSVRRPRRPRRPSRPSRPRHSAATPRSTDCEVSPRSRCWSFTSGCSARRTTPGVARASLTTPSPNCAWVCICSSPSRPSCWRARSYARPSAAKRHRACCRTSATEW